MDEQTLRARAEAFGQALVDGDIERAIRDLSPELQRNPGEVIALLPLPASEVSIESIEHGGKADNVVLRLVGDGGESSILTRWKERDGRPCVVELRHEPGSGAGSGASSVPDSGMGEEAR